MKAGLRADVESSPTEGRISRGVVMPILQMTLALMWDSETPPDAFFSGAATPLSLSLFLSHNFLLQLSSLSEAFWLNQ